MGVAGGPYPSYFNNSADLERAKRLGHLGNLILISALLATLAGFLFSYAFTAKYVSQSTILLEGQKVPESMVQPLASEDLGVRMATLQQLVLSQANLQPVVQRVFPGKSSQETAELIDEIRLNMTVEQLPTDLLLLGAERKPGGEGNSGGFYVSYTAPNPREAQQICNELTSLLVGENLKLLADRARETIDFLSRGIGDAQRNLDEVDSKLAAFRKQYVGQLPGSEANNLNSLMELNSQLESNTQTLNRAQQDKEYAESMLAQQLAVWKMSQSASNRQTLQQQLIDLQAQLIDLQPPDANDHPDVIKIKADIAQVRKKLAQITGTSATATDTANDKESGLESAEILQLRLQVHQYGTLIAAATRDQQRYQQEIGVYQGRVAMSPAVEEQYKVLTRDYDNANKSYAELTSKRETAKLTIDMENMGLGERMVFLNPADLPDDPVFPNRFTFSLVGLGAGLVFGIGLAFRRSKREKRRGQRDKNPGQSSHEGLPVSAV